MEELASEIVVLQSLKETRWPNAHSILQFKGVIVRLAHTNSILSSLYQSGAKVTLAQGPDVLLIQDFIHETVC